MRAALLQHLFVAGGLEVDRSGVSGRLVETYPAAALRAWGFAFRGYKGAKNSEVREVLVRELLGGVGALRPAADRVLVGASDHVVDAFVCAIVAAASRGVMTATPGPDDRPLAVAEGWIHVPTASLRDVVGNLTRETPDRSST